MYSSWQFLGETVILFLATLRAVPLEVLDQAAIDGATGLRRFGRILLPLLMPSVVVIVVLATITSLQAFTWIYVLTQGGPGTATTTTAFYIYQQAFEVYDSGTADAMAAILFVVTLGVTLLQVNVLGRMGGAGHEAPAA
jgi:multiple sugar transport system permease protein